MNLDQCKIDVGEFSVALACDNSNLYFDQINFAKLNNGEMPQKTQLLVADIESLMANPLPYYSYIDRSNYMQYSDIQNVKVMRNDAERWSDK